MERIFVLLRSPGSATAVLLGATQRWSGLMMH